MWVSPNSYTKLTGGSAAMVGDVTTAPSGTLLEQQTQTTLTWFVKNGGRLFLDAPDLSDALINMGQLPQNFATWLANTKYAAGATVQPTAANGYYYTCTVAGTSGANQPAWPTITGTLVIDGTVTWIASPQPGNMFVSTVLGVEPYQGNNPTTFSYPDPGYIDPFLVGLGFNTFAPGSAAAPPENNIPPAPGSPTWYGWDLWDWQWKTGWYQSAHNTFDSGGNPIPPYVGHTGREQAHQHETLPANPNPDASFDLWSGNCLVGGFTEGDATFVHELYWGPMTLNPAAQKARNAFACTYCEDSDEHGQNYFGNETNSPYVVGASNEYGAGRSVLWTFGYYDLSLGYRNRPTWDTLEWLRDGTVRGRVMQNNPQVPIIHALVVATDGANGGFAGATYTDDNGNYVLYGLRPGSASITVTTNGYYSINNSLPTSIIGGQTEYVNFYLKQDIDLSRLQGYVTLRGVPVSGAPVTATPAANGLPTSTVSQADGSYSFTLPVGTYNLTGTDPTTGQSTTIPNVTLLANETVTQNIELARICRISR